MQLGIMWFINVLAAFLPWRMWKRKALQLPRDFFFLLLYAQAYVLLHLAPTLFIQSGNEGLPGSPDSRLQWLYILIQLSAILLFEWPLLHWYTRAFTTPPKQTWSGAKVPEPRLSNAIAVSVFAIVFSLTFLGLAIRYGVLRLPHVAETIAELLVDLPTPIYAVHRLFVYSGPFLASVLLVLLLRIKQGPGRRIVAAAFCITAGSWLLYALLNYRGLTVLGVATLGGVFLVCRDRSALGRNNGGQKSTLPTLIMGGVVATYGVIVATNIRFDYESSGGLSWQLFSQLLNLREFMPGDRDPNTDLRWRLNGLDLMARITPEAMRTGYAMGDGWKYPALIGLGQWVARGAVEKYKLDWLSDPKVYLLWRYTDLNYIDWPNTFISDLYGNLAFPGFLLGAFILSSVYRRGAQALTRPVSATSLLFGIYLLTQSLDFQQSFAVWLFGLLRAAPILVFLFFVNPFQAPSDVTASGASQAFQN
jgi:hypothetical protein